ncbi:DUF6328 family protein [Motilibacter aurantiacus]|uniref:DUF6328 family protein n=1 Tax=Motilibacter aurantiacus TaxID=2714955 RepID=UPI001408A493|nr:DUF6328 family protein [Motilibacter aurantiacus]NHC45379.1 hypothetical protein [Motilibacter aurantiacus]
MVKRSADELREARGETREQQLDRNLGELVQELRVAQTGVQFLFAAVLAIPFQQRFNDLTAFQERVYVVTLVLTLFAATMLVAPASFHRAVFRRGLKAELVSAADRMFQLGLLALALAMTAAVLLVLDVVLESGRVVGGLVALAVVWFAAFWYAWPLAVRAARSRRAPEDE